ncbi:MAG: hypothetical protein V3W32_08755 [Gemmatimonadota bacterium]
MGKNTFKILLLLVLLVASDVSLPPVRVEVLPATTQEVRHD